MPITRVKGGGNGKLAEQMRGIITGPTNQVAKQTRRVLSEATREGLAQPGERRMTTPRGTTLLREVRKVMKIRVIDPKDGLEKTNLRICAETFVEMMKDGEFPFHNEYIQREEGKVKNNLGDDETLNIKVYVGLPLDDQPGAP